MLFQFWDVNGQAVTAEKNARFFTTIQKLNDTCWQMQNYEMMGPMISSEQYKDKAGTILHGRSAFMRTDGTLDSMGFFVNGRPNGIWMYFNNDGVLWGKKEYFNGEVISTWTPGQAGTDQKNTIHDEPDTQAEFVGGSKAWLRYLLANLRYPEYAKSRNINGHVKLLFVIDENGRVTDDIVLKSAEFTLDNEARRLLRASPKWTPATKNGQKVKSYQKTGIGFTYRQT